MSRMSELDLDRQQVEQVFGLDRQMTIVHVSYTNEFKLIGRDGFLVGIYASRADANRARNEIRETRS